MKATLFSLIPSVIVYRSARAGGSFNRQSLRLTPEGIGYFMLLFMQILKGVMAKGPLLYASTMLMELMDPLYALSSSVVRHLKTGIVC